MNCLEHSICISLSAISKQVHICYKIRYTLYVLIYVHACKNRNDILAKIVKFGLKRPVLHPCFVAVLQTASKPLDLTWPYTMWKNISEVESLLHNISMTIHFFSFLGKTTFDALMMKFYQNFFMKNHVSNWWSLVLYVDVVNKSYGTSPLTGSTFDRSERTKQMEQ